MRHTYFLEINPPTINALLSLTVHRYADRPALSYVDGEGFTYREMAAAAFSFAKALDEKGIPPKAHIALLAQSSPWWGIAYFGIVGSGRVAVPILPDFPAEDIAAIMEHSDSEWMVVSEKLIKKVESTGKKFHFIGIEGFRPFHKSADYTPQTPRDFLPSLTEADFQGALPYFEAKNPNPDDMISIIYTSGTSGMSKGVMLSHRNICFDANSANAVPPNRPIGNTLSILPLSHAYECSIGLFTTLTRGCHIHYLRRPLSVAALLPALKSIRPQMMMSVPILLEKIFKKQVLPQLTRTRFLSFLYSVRPFQRLLHRIAGRKLFRTFGGRMIFFGIGGAGLDPVVERFLRDAKFPYAMGYGLTETSPLVVGSDFKHSRYRSTGHLIPDVEVKIDHPDPKTGDGEILVRGQNVMLGYYKNPSLTQEVMTDDGFFRTGDKGHLQGNFLFISGRVKNMILTANGENIYPEALESIINQMDYVEESLVFENKNDHKIVAKVFLDKESFAKALEKSKEALSSGFKSVTEFLNSVREKVNQKLPVGSRINVMVEQKEPFEKTATNKIKRFKHDSLEKNDDSHP